MRSFSWRAALSTVALLLGATVVGLITLWPDERTLEPEAARLTAKTQSAEVVSIAAVPCRVPGRSGCRRVTVRVLSGPDEGTTAAITVGDPGTEVAVSVGDRLRVFKNPVPEGAAADPRIEPYGFADFERRAPLLWLALAFAALVLASGRWQGLRALAGLAASLAVVVGFVVPAILGGEEPAWVALVGGFAVMFATIPLAHGVGAKAVAALLGSAASLTLVLVLARAFTSLAHLTGFSSDEALYLRATAGEDISIQGLLLAGMVIGALGVLDDLTGSQASTVMALRRANPGYGFRSLFRSAVSVGHDHIAATVNTLFLAYAGAALPVLLIFSLGDVSLSEAVNSEAVAGEVVAMLVGSIGLVAAVPITTSLAALLATRLPAEVGASSHVH